MDQQKLVARLLDVIENDLLPITEESVSIGNLIYGAVILKKTDLSVVIAGNCS